MNIQYWNNTKDFFPEEEWYSIPDYVGLYEYSSLGRIRSFERISSYNNRKYPARIMKQFLNPDGYPMIELHKNGVGVKFKVHRLLAIVHIPNPENKKEVNHKRGIKTDNRLTEIEWSTTAENIQHAYDYLGKVTPMKGKFESDCPNSKKVKCDTLDIEFPSATKAGTELGIKTGRISEVCLGKRKQYEGLTFRYL